MSLNPKTTIAIGKIAEKIIANAQLEDPESVKAFRDTIITACNQELVGFAPPGTVAAPAPAAARPVAAKPAAKKGTGGLNGYTLFSKETRAKLTTDMGADAAKAFFVKEGGVQVYIPNLWNALEEPEQEVWNARAKEIREDGGAVAESSGAAAPVGKVNMWHPFQKAFPAYLAAEGIVLAFTELATKTGEKYQELKKQGPQAVVDFIAQYPPLPKEKKSNKKKAAGVAAAAAAAATPTEI
jgi:hypothetical protein